MEHMFIINLHSKYQINARFIWLQSRSFTNKETIAFDSCGLIPTVFTSVLDFKFLTQVNIIYNFLFELLLVLDGDMSKFMFLQLEKFKLS